MIVREWVVFVDRVHERGYFNQFCDNWKFDWRGNQIRKENENLRVRERERDLHNSTEVLREHGVRSRWRGLRAPFRDCGQHLLLILFRLFFFFFVFFCFFFFFDRRRSVKFPQISLSFCVLSSDDEERNVKTTTTYEQVKFGPKFF